MPGGACLVVDFGTGGTKVILFGPRGDLIHKSALPVAFRFSQGAADFDPQGVWLQVCGQVRRAVRAAARARVRVSAVSSTSMREGNVFYDGDGRELLAVPNIDGRAAKEAEEIARTHGDMIYESSGHWPMASFLVCRLRWLRHNLPGTHRRTKRVSMINDWLLYRLSGVLASEPTNGCETAAFDLAKRDWSPEIAREMKIDEGLLPPVKEGGSVLGTVAPRAARATGLPRSTLVVVGGADTESALAGCGVWTSGRVAAVAGTTTPVQAVVGEPKVDPERRTWTSCHVAPGRWVVESNAGATGLVFDWWARLTKEGYDALTREAEGVPPGSGGVESMVGAMVFNARQFPKIHGELRGIMPWTQRGAISRAIIEGTCLAVRANLEQVELVLGEKFGELVFCGGAAESTLWSQIQADVVNRRVARHQGTDATARGALALCRLATGESASLEDSPAGTSRVLRPRKSEAEAYEAQYRRWAQETS